MSAIRARSQELEARLASFLEDLEALVTCESPSADVEALDRCAGLVDDLAVRLLGQPSERIEAGGRQHLRWRFGGPGRVLLLGHLDTVWPIGTLDEMPFEVHYGERITGPGVFDMKVGLLSILHAVSVLDDPDGVTILITTDEELGSPTSRDLIERTAQGHHGCLITEPSADGAVKVARKGVSLYELVVHGRAAHAGLEPESGVNALLELASQVSRIAALGDRTAGTTVTPTVATAGSTTNTVPARAEVAIDVRAWESDEQERVDRALRQLAPLSPGAELELIGGINRPPMTRDASRPVFELAHRIAEELGMGSLDGVAVGGGSDGNFTAAAGVPTLDGLGAVGDGAHAKHEHALVPAIAPRTALLAELTDRLRRAPV